MKVSSSTDVCQIRQSSPTKSNSNCVSSTSSHKFKKYTKECTYLRLTNRNLLDYLPQISSTSWFKNKKQIVFPQTIQKIDDNGFKQNSCQQTQTCFCAMCPNGIYYPQIEVYDGQPLELDDEFGFKDNFDAKTLKSYVNVNTKISQTHSNVTPNGYVKIVPKGSNWF